MRPTAFLLLVLVAGLAWGQDDDGVTFLEGDKVTCKSPPLRVTRPDDGWQFIDVEKVKAKRKQEGLSVQGWWGSLRAQLWYGAARANVYVHAWLNGEVVTLDVIADQQIKDLKKSVRDAEVVKRKKVKIGKRVGLAFTIAGKVPDPKDPTKDLKEITITKAVCFRAEDKAIVTFSLEYYSSDDPKRAKSLDKALKAILKQAKF